MGFLRSLFGKEQTVRASNESELSQTASPVAVRLDKVINEMCAKPGRSFNKKARIRDIAARLSPAQSYLSQEKFQNAIEWHMNNFDAGKLTFE